MQVKIRPTIAADIPHFTVEPLPFRIKAITLLVDDEVKAIGGLAFPENGSVVVFMDQTEDLRRYPVAIHRAGRAGMKLIWDSGINEVLATVEPANAKALRWIKRFGFVESVHQPIDGKTAFFWTRESQP